MHLTPLHHSSSSQRGSASPLPDGVFPEKVCAQDALSSLRDSYLHPSERSSLQSVSITSSHPKVEAAQRRLLLPSDYSHHPDACQSFEEKRSPIDLQRCVDLLVDTAHKQGAPRSLRLFRQMKMGWDPLASSIVSSVAAQHPDAGWLLALEQGLLPALLEDPDSPWPMPSPSLRASFLEQLCCSSSPFGISMPYTPALLRMLGVDTMQLAQLRFADMRLLKKSVLPQEVGDPAQLAQAVTTGQKFLEECFRTFPGYHWPFQAILQEHQGITKQLWLEMAIHGALATGDLEHHSAFYDLVPNYLGPWSKRLPPFLVLWHCYPSYASACQKKRPSRWEECIQPEVWLQKMLHEEYTESPATLGSLLCMLITAGRSTEAEALWQKASTRGDPVDASYSLFTSSTLRVLRAIPELSLHVPPGLWEASPYRQLLHAIVRGENTQALRLLDEYADLEGQLLKKDPEGRGLTRCVEIYLHFLLTGCGEEVSRWIRSRPLCMARLAAEVCADLLANEAPSAAADYRAFLGRLALPPPEHAPQWEPTYLELAWHLHLGIARPTLTWVELARLCSDRALFPPMEDCTWERPIERLFHSCACARPDGCYELLDACHAELSERCDHDLATYHARLTEQKSTLFADEEELRAAWLAVLQSHCPALIDSWLESAYLVPWPTPTTANGEQLTPQGVEHLAKMGGCLGSLSPSQQSTLLELLNASLSSLPNKGLLHSILSCPPTLGALQQGLAKHLIAQPLSRSFFLPHLPAIAQIEDGTARALLYSSCGLVGSRVPHPLPKETICLLQKLLLSTDPRVEVSGCSALESMLSAPEVGEWMAPDVWESSLSWKLAKHILNGNEGGALAILQRFPHIEALRWAIKHEVMRPLLYPLLRRPEVTHSLRHDRTVLEVATSTQDLTLVALLLPFCGIDATHAEEACVKLEYQEISLSELRRQLAPPHSVEASLSYLLALQEETEARIHNKLTGNDTQAGWQQLVARLGRAEEGAMDTQLLQIARPLFKEIELYVNSKMQIDIMDPEQLVSIERDLRSFMLDEIEHKARHTLLVTHCEQPSCSLSPPLAELEEAEQWVVFIEENRQELLDGRPAAMARMRSLATSLDQQAVIAWRCYDPHAPCSDWPNLFTAPSPEEGSASIFAPLVDGQTEPETLTEASLAARRHAALIACLSYDPSLPEGQGLEMRRMLLAQLAEIRRAHNQSDYQGVIVDDGEVDNPSCAPGTTGRLLMIARAHPAFRPSAGELCLQHARMLLGHTLNRHLAAALAACRDDQERTLLYDAISTLTPPLLWELSIEPESIPLLSTTYYSADLPSGYSRGMFARRTEFLARCGASSWDHWRQTLLPLLKAKLGNTEEAHLCAEEERFLFIHTLLLGLPETTSQFQATYQASLTRQEIDRTGDAELARLLEERPEPSSLAEVDTWYRAVRRELRDHPRGRGAYTPRQTAEQALSALGMNWVIRTIDAHRGDTADEAASALLAAAHTKTLPEEERGQLLVLCQRLSEADHPSTLLEAILETCSVIKQVLGTASNERVLS